MKIRLERLSGSFHMKCTNEGGHSIETDGSPKIGGTNKAVRPMEAVIMALASCSSIDVISILKKQRQILKDIRIDIEADRETDQVPSLFKKIHMHFELMGDLSDKKAQKAIQLSVDKYCSVAETLRRSGATISWDYQILNIDE